MRVLFVIDSLGAGGAEQSTAMLAERLLSMGVESSIATLYRAEVGFEAQVSAAHVPVHRITGTGVAQRVRQLRALTRQIQPDVLHTALFAADQIGRLSAVGLPVKVVSSFVNTPRSKGYDPAVREWKRRVVNLVDAITGHMFVDQFHAVTEGVGALYADRYRIRTGKITVVERGRDTALLGTRSPERRSDTRSRLGLDSGTPVVVAAGRHEPQKAHADLIRSMQVARKQFPNAMLLIAGREGASTAQIKATIQQCDATSWARLLGHREDVADLLAAADVMALPSHFEGTAGIALEAMALGTPIASTDLKGMQGILVHERNALISAIGDVDAMAASITRLLRDRALGERLGDAARDDFLDRFTLERSANRMLAMYNDLAHPPTTERHASS